MQLAARIRRAFQLVLEDEVWQFKACFLPARLVASLLLCDDCTRKGLTETIHALLLFLEAVPSSVIQSLVHILSYEN